MATRVDRTRARPRGRRFRLAVALLLVVAMLQLAAGLAEPPTTGPGGDGSGIGASPSVPAGASSGTGSPDAGAPSPSPRTTSAPSVEPEVVSPGPDAASPGPDLATGSTGSASWIRAWPWVVAALDGRLALLQQTLGLPGISATIIFPDGTRWTGVAGEADLADGVPVRPGTPFPLASISKTFTAALILQLVDEGRLTLDEPAAPYLAPAGITLDRRITIHQLLDHTSGLSDYLTTTRIDAAFRADPDVAWTPQQALRFLPGPRYAPGRAFYYSNTNYLLLGLIAEEITGDSVAENLRTRFFEPLGLLTASYQGVEDPWIPLARAYRFTTGNPGETPIQLPTGTPDVPFRSVVTAAGAAGSVAASSVDVAAWARALYTGQVLSPRTTAQMVDDAARDKAVDPRLPYGLGVHVLEVDGHPTFGHTGRYLGIRTVVRHLPLEGVTIAVLTNQSRHDLAPIVVELLRLALGEGTGGGTSG